MKIEVKYYPISDNCKVPTNATADSAGYDLYVAEKKKFCHGPMLLFPLTLSSQFLLVFLGRYFLDLDYV